MRISGFRGERLGRILGFRGEDLGFVGIRAFVESFGLSWRGIRGGDAFGISCFRAFAGKASGFGGEASGVGGVWAFVGRIWGFVRGGTSFRGEEFRLSNRFYESKASGSPLKTNRFCEPNRFYEITA